MKETTDILHVVKKGKLMDMPERFHIYKETKIENQINDNNTVAWNILFDTILPKYTSRCYPSLPVQSEQH